MTSTSSIPSHRSEMRHSVGKGARSARAKRRLAYELRWRLNLRRRGRFAFPIIDALSLPFTALSALHFRFLRFIEFKNLGANQRLLDLIGIFPVRRHYYDPLVTPDSLRRPLDDHRHLPGLSFNEEEQLQLIRELSFQEELRSIPFKPSSPTEYGYDNGTFYGVDGAFLYSMIRRCRPRRVIEVGSGNSTLVAARALAANSADGITADHLCIEPYEMPWLESTGVRVERSRAEDLDPALFTTLEQNDILFIDSSHMLRPQGDVLFLYQQVLPVLRPGVVIHIHDIFTPRDYPREWVVKRRLFWNEQYMLEAFLTFNSRFRVLAAAHWLYHTHRQELASAFPILEQHPEMPPPTSLWMVVA